MIMLVLLRKYEDGEGYDHSAFLGVFSSYENARAAAIHHWRQTPLKKLGEFHSGQKSVQDTIERNREEFNQQVQTGDPPDGEFEIRPVTVDARTP